MNERDPELQALWRAQSNETPPSSLDDAIRAAAHRAVHAGPVPAARARAPWLAWAPLAVAASIGVIAIGVWQLQPKDTDVITATVTDVPARMAATPRVSAPKSPPAARPSEPAARDSATAAERKDETDITLADAKRAAPAQQSGAMVAPPATAKRAAPAQRSEAMAPPPVNTEKRSDSINARPPTANASSANAPAPNAPMAMVAPPPPAPAAPLAQVAPAPMERASVTNQSSASGTISDKRAVDASERAQPAAQQEADAVAGAGRDMSGNARMAAKTARSDSGSAPTAAQAAPGDGGSTRMAAKPAPTSGSNARSVTSYVDAIRHALDAHQIDLAVAQLTAMRAQYPDADAKLPMELRVWAATVPRDNP